MALALICLATAITQFTYTSPGWFYLDDIRNLGDARRSGLTWHLLVSPIGNEHFQPGGRLLHWLVIAGGGQHFAFAEAILAVSVASIGYLTARLADQLFGPRVLHLLLAAMIGTSSTLVEASTWYAGSDAIPSTALMAGGALLYCRWYQNRGAYRLVGSVGSAAAAVLCWEQAIIMPFLLALLWLCFLRHDSTASAGERRPLRQVALSLLPFAMVSFAFDAYVQAQPWYRPLITPSPEQVLDLLRVMLVRGMLPPIVGWRVSTSPMDAAAITSILLALGVLVVGAVCLLVRRRFRWTGVVFFAASFLALAATVAVTRVDIGPLAGATPRYLCPLPMLAGLAVAACASGRRRQAKSAPAVQGQPPSTMRRGLLAAIAIVAGLGYFIALTDSTNANRFGRVNGQKAHSISDRVGHTLHPGMTNLVDTRLGWPIFYPSTDGADEVSTLAPFWVQDVHAIGQGPNPIAIAPDGTARAVRFNADHPGPGQYVRLTVRADQATRMVVALVGAQPIEPNRPCAIDVPAGTTSFILPVWAAHLTSSHISPEPGLTVVSQRVGTITLAAPVP